MKAGEKFVERGTDYKFRHGTLSVYETNCPCKGIEFKFENFMFTLMISGHKTVTSENLKVEFIPEMLFIPERGIVQEVEIANASFTNPTKCLVLDIDPHFLESFYFEIIEENEEYVSNKSTKLTHFFSNDISTIETFKRLYAHVASSLTETDQDINTCILKELLLRIFRTEAGELLVQNFNGIVDDRAIEKVMFHVKSHLLKKMTIDDLVKVSGVGKTKLFTKFKSTLGISPVTFIMRERIKHAKTLIPKADSLQLVAYQSGFNTYEHFYKSFKKIEGCTPLEFKKENLKRKNLRLSA